MTSCPGSTVRFVVGEESRPSWNVAPTQDVRVVLEHLPSNDPCVLPADGHYEWQATPDGKQPYFLHDEKVLNMAACTSCGATRPRTTTTQPAGCGPRLS